MSSWAKFHSLLLSFYPFVKKSSFWQKKKKKKKKSQGRSITMIFAQMNWFKDYLPPRHGYSCLPFLSKVSKTLIYSLSCNQSKFDDVDIREFDDARSRANPYEKIGRSVFINRAAVKMAELDFQYSLLPKSGNDPFYFGDICAGPGGFSG